MSYTEAKAYKAQLEAAVDAADKNLKAFDAHGKSSFGLTPDHVKAMPEWQVAKLAFDRSFAALRNLNGAMNKAFKKEIMADRRARAAARVA